MNIRWKWVLRNTSGILMIASPVALLLGIMLGLQGLNRVEILVSVLLAVLAAAILFLCMVLGLMIVDGWI